MFKAIRQHFKMQLAVLIFTVLFFSITQVFNVFSADTAEDYGYREYINYSYSKVLDKSSTVKLGAGFTVGKKTYKPDKYTDIVYPVLSGMKNQGVQKKINKVFYDRMKVYYKDAYNSVKENGFDKNSGIGGGFIIQHCSSKALNIILDYYTYTGGAHGMPYRDSIIVSLESGKAFRFKDIFSSKKYMDIVNASIKKDFKDRKLQTFGEFKSISPENTNYFLTNDGFVVFFPPYEYTAYAFGFLQSKVKYTLLKSVIKEKNLLLSDKGESSSKKGNG